ncbi:MAG: hypothetical protein WCL51_07665 [Bacteroidota bacterium]
MKDLKRMAVNPFLGLGKYGREKIQLFIFLHIMFMKSQLLDHTYLAPIIPLTETLYDTIFGLVTTKDQKIELRKSQRKTVVQVLVEAKVAAHTIEGRVKDKVTKSSPIYSELFGNGIDEYNHFDLKNSYILISRLKDGVKKYQIELGDDMLTLITGVYDDFDEARKAQALTAGEVRGNNPNYEKSLDLMEIQLYKNFLEICKDNSNDPSNGWGFFDQPVLTRPSHHAGNPNKEPLTLGIDPLSQKEAGMPFSIINKFSIKNMCNVPIYYMGAFTADEAIHPNSLVILPGQTITVTAAQLGSPSNRYLIFANKDIKELGVVKITLE